MSALFENGFDRSPPCDRRTLVDLRGDVALVDGLDDGAKRALLVADLLERAARTAARWRWNWDRYP